MNVRKTLLCGRMFHNPFLRTALTAKLCNWIQQQQRNVRPTIKIGKEKFELKINVKEFHKEELRVKARNEYVIVEGKQDKKTKKGYLIRHFVRKFKLPYGCSPETMQVNLSREGVLTVTAPRKTCDKNLPCEAVIPIKTIVQQDKMPTLAAVQQPADEKPKDTKS